MQEDEFIIRRLRSRKSGSVFIHRDVGETINLRNADQPSKEVTLTVKSVDLATRTIVTDFDGEEETWQAGEGFELDVYGASCYIHLMGLLADYEPPEAYFEVTEMSDNLRMKRGEIQWLP